MAHPVRPSLKPRVGRPRRGTEAERAATLLSAATRVFLREGYGSASIDKVASEAGVSTRTIYERFKNKADLLSAVTTRLIERDMDLVLATEKLEHMDPRQALTMVGEAVALRACDPEIAALFRILATEAYRFPELAAKMRGGAKSRLDHGIAAYLRGQIQRRTLVVSDPDRAAALFFRMVTCELQECVLFGTADELVKLDFAAHLQLVVDIFLRGTLPRGVAPPDSQTS